MLATNLKAISVAVLTDTSQHVLPQVFRVRFFTFDFHSAEYAWQRLVTMTADRTFVRKI